MKTWKLTEQEMAIIKIEPMVFSFRKLEDNVGFEVLSLAFV